MFFTRAFLLRMKFIWERGLTNLQEKQVCRKEVLLQIWPVLKMSSRFEFHLDERGVFHKTFYSA